jgi:hypothetical protein
MATTMYLDGTIKDKEKKDAEIALEFGRSSFYGESLMYFEVGGKLVIIDKATGMRIFDEMMRLGAFLGYGERSPRGQKAPLAQRGKERQSTAKSATAIATGLAGTGQNET